MNDRDELEYHFTFPESKPPPLPGPRGPARPPGAPEAAGPEDESPASSRASSDDFVFVYDEGKRPVVVLLGWAGCQDKYLAKYSAIYEERSCITLRCTAPLECLFWRRHRLPLISRRLLQLIGEKCSDDRPVFFHIFSNGGAIFYQHISSAMQQAGSPLKVKGVIFDSSPGQRRLTSLYRAISAIIGGRTYTNVPISFAITFFLSIFWLMEIVMNFLGKENVVQTDPIALAEETYSWPQIFLYSNTDTLIYAKDVEKFATRRAERGVRTRLVLFTDSPHVKHFATYKDVYVNTIYSFMNDCLGDEPGIENTTSEPQDEPSDDEDDDVFDEKDSLLCLTKRIIQPQEATSL